MPTPVVVGRPIDSLLSLWSQFLINVNRLQISLMIRDRAGADWQGACRRQLLHNRECPLRTPNCQKPSSAKPTQLTTNIDEARAAKVTIVLTDRTNMTPLQAITNSVELVLPKQGENYAQMRFNPTVAAPPQGASRPQKPTFAPLSVRVCGESKAWSVSRSASPRNI
jgi:hypothetical protein